ncbi:MAG: WYL domain-containing protein [Spirosomataceae bacterium]
MRKGRENDGKRIKRLLTLHQLLRGGRTFSTEALQEAYFHKTGLSVEAKTLQNDLRFMREELGAPLPEKANKHTGYYYQNVSYSILEALDESPYSSLNEALALLRKAAKSVEFVGLEDILLRLEQRISVTDAEKNAFIQFEEVILKGKDYLPKLAQHINKDFLRIGYQPFNEALKERHIFPLLLKEYNNRWFLIAWEESNSNVPHIFALDRIEGPIHTTGVSFPYDKSGHWQERFSHMIGVTLEGMLEEVTLRFSARRFVYVETKKLHHSQQLTGERTISLYVYTNRELKAKVLEFGTDVEVLAPDTLRQQIIEIIKEQTLLYPSVLNT